MASSPLTPPVSRVGTEGVRASGCETQRRSWPRVMTSRRGCRETVPHAKDSSAARQSGLERSDLESGAGVPTTPEPPVPIGGVAGDTTRSFVGGGPRPRGACKGVTEGKGLKTPTHRSVSASAARQIGTLSRTSGEWDEVPNACANTCNGHRGPDIHRHGLPAAMQEPER